MQYLTCFSFLILVIAATATGKDSERAAAVTWSYAGKSAWATKFKDFCGGKRQSPVNIDRFSTKFGFYWGFQFKNYAVLPSSMLVTNSGKTVSVTFTSSAVPSVSGGGLKGTYNLHHMHFHWGSDGTHGSEHTINSVRYPMELHMVHFKSAYGNIGEAIKKHDGLAVLGVLFEISTNDNPALEPIVQALTKTITSGASSPASRPYAFSSILPPKLNHFYRYSGGLTTPLCNEIVTWTLFKHTSHISLAQLAKFRALQDSSKHTLVNNYRDPQPLNGRKVHRSWFF